MSQTLPNVFGPEAATELGFFHGEEDPSHLLAAAKAGGFAHRMAFVKRPPLPIPYGTHHTKAIFAFTHDLTSTATEAGGTATGVRVAILTSNFLYDDVLRKNQGFFVQDFPLKTATPTTASVDANDFGQRLMEYLTVVGAGRLVKPLDGLTNVDFSQAAARLVASVPGYHQQPQAAAWGQARLSRVLRRIPLSATAAAADQRDESSSHLVWQYSSQGSLNDPFLGDLRAAMSAHRPDGTPPIGAVKVVLPSEEEVRCSVEGWRAGLSIPVTMKVFHPFINARLHRFTPRHFFSPVPVSTTLPPLTQAVVLARPLAISERTRAAPIEKRFHTVAGRHRAMPHIKSYACVVQPPPVAAAGCNQQQPGEEGFASAPYLAWLCCTSANLSRAAWGDWQKKGSQLMIRSYELGLVYSADLPAVGPEAGQASFTLTPQRPLWPLGTLHPASNIADAQLLADLQLGYGAFPSLLGCPRQPPPLDGEQRPLQRRALFLPYAIHCLRPYVQQGGGGARDTPWAVDFPHQGPDILRQPPSVLAAYSHYGAGSWTAAELSWAALDASPDVILRRPPPRGERRLHDARPEAAAPGGGGVGASRTAAAGSRDDPVEIDD
jgi:tyrosyl-DNA phosphodiesterase-1